jgi:hypothetical protein
MYYSQNVYNLYCLSIMWLQPLLDLIGFLMRKARFAV